MHNAKLKFSIVFILKEIEAAFDKSKNGFYF
jgi:hypothetical protein